MRLDLRRVPPPLLIALLAVGCGARSDLEPSPDAASTLDAARVDGGAADAAPRPDLPTATDVPAGVDLPIPVDVPPGGCARASQCTMPPFSDMTFASGWSCIAGRCVWEMNAGRTCVRAPDGCMECDREPRRTCPGARCEGPLARDAVRLERAYCARDFFSSVRGCAGGFVALDDQVCTLTEAPTGALRYVLACGPCETVYAPR